MTSATADNKLPDIHSKGFSFIQLCRGFSVSFKGRIFSEYGR
jgi:hypothetical protein